MRIAKEVLVDLGNNFQYMRAEKMCRAYANDANFVDMDESGQDLGSSVVHCCWTSRTFFFG